MRKLFTVIFLIIFLSLGVHGLLYNSSTYYELPNSSHSICVGTYETITLEIKTNSSTPVEIAINEIHIELIPNVPLKISNISGPINVITSNGYFLLMLKIGVSTLLKEIYLSVGIFGSILTLAIIRKTSLKR
jgi:hypothetical protein